MCRHRETERRTEIEAELQKIREIQANVPVARDQATGEHLVAKIYKALQTNESLTSEALHFGSTELQRLYAQREALRIRPDGMMEIRLVINKKACCCVVCPPAIRKTVSHLGHAWIGPLWDESYGGTTSTGLVLAWHDC